MIAMRRRAMKLAASGVTDSFNRADSTTTMGSADTGQAWTPNSGTWGIDANRARLVSATDQATTVLGSGLANCTARVTLALGVVDGIGLCFRSTDDNNHFVVENNNGSIFRKQAGSYTSLGNPGVTIAENDVMEVVLNGSSIVLKKNGTTILSVTDAFNSTATRHGLRCNARTASRFDNFEVAP